jgi:hypothetical protein
VMKATIVKSAAEFSKTRRRNITIADWRLRIAD